MAVPSLKDYFKQAKAKVPTPAQQPAEADIKVVQAQPNATVVPPGFVGPLRQTPGASQTPMPAVPKPQADNVGLQQDYGIGTDQTLQPAAEGDLYNPVAPTKSLRDFMGAKLPVSGVDGTPVPKEKPPTFFDEDTRKNLLATYTKAYGKEMAEKLVNEQDYRAAGIVKPEEVMLYNMTEPERKAYQIAKFTNTSTGDLLKSEYGDNLATKVGGFVLNLVDPVSKTLSSAQIASQISDDVATGKIDPRVYDMIQDLHKTVPQVIADATQVGLLAVPAFTAEGALTQGGKVFAEQGLKQGIVTLAKVGAKEGFSAGLAYGVAQAVSSGSTDPNEIDKIILSNMIGGTLLGGLGNPALSLLGKEGRAAISGQVSNLIAEHNRITSNLVEDFVAQGFTRNEAERLATQGGYVNFNPKADELGQKINQLNKQWVENPTAANKKALENAKAEYKNISQVDDMADFIVGKKEDIEKLYSAQRQLEARIEKGRARQPYVPSEMTDRGVKRGEEAIVQRLRLEENFNGLPRHQVDTVTRFIDDIGPDLLDDVGISIRSKGGQQGQFEYGKSLITLFKDNIMNNGGKVDRTVIHEMWHSLARYLPEADVSKVSNTFLKEKSAYIKKNPWFQEVLDGLQNGINKDQYEAFAKKYPEQTKYWAVDPNSYGELKYKPQFDSANYRFKNIDEWFAENLTDKSFQRFAEMDASTRSIFAHAKNVFKEMVRGVQRLFGGDTAGRILDNFTQEKNTEMVRSSNLAGSVDTSMLENKAVEPPPATPKTADHTDDMPVKNGFYNMDKLAVSPEAKAVISKEIDDAKASVEKIIGKKIQHKEWLDLASKVSKSTEKTFGRNEQVGFLAKAHNAQAQLAEVGERMAKGEAVAQDEFINSFMEAKSVKTFAGRLLDSFKESAKASPAEKPVMQAILDKLDKEGVNIEKIIEEAKKIDWNDPEAVISFYRQQVSATKGEWVDLIRMSSMLTSPNTHIVNFSSNFFNTGVLRPATLEVRAALDPFRAVLTGTERRYFMGEGVKYAKGYFGSLKQAWGNFLDTVNRKTIDTSSEYTHLPLTETGTAGRKVENVLSIGPRLLEAWDRFSATMSESGTASANEYRAKLGSKIVDDPHVTAAKDLMRSTLEKNDGSKVLNFVDWLPARLQSMKSNENIIVRTVGKFTFPFVRFGANAFKSGLEYSPAGITTLWGATNKQEQLAKFVIGLTNTTLVAVVAANGNITGPGPVTQGDKDAWAAAGRKPWSIKIGGKWISYSRLPPALGLNFAIVAAVKQGLENGKLSEDQAQTTLGVAGTTLNFMFDQTYMRNVGQAVAATKGDQTAMAQLLSNYPQQMIPYRAMLSWVERLTDPVQRKVDPNGTLLKKQLQAIEAQIPGLSHLVPGGQPISVGDRLINAVSPLGVSTSNPAGEQVVQNREDLSRLRKQETTVKKGEQQKVDNIIKEFQSAPPEQRAQILQDKIKSGEITNDMAKTLINTLKEKTQGDISNVLQGNSNTVKAKFIADKLQTLPVEERKAFIQQLAEQKVMTADLTQKLTEELKSRINKK